MHDQSQNQFTTEKSQVKEIKLECNICTQIYRTKEQSIYYMLDFENKVKCPLCSIAEEDASSVLYGI